MVSTAVLTACVATSGRSVSVVRFRSDEKMEVGLGEEAQIDFGKGAWIVADARASTSNAGLRVVLSHSRKGYSEAVFRQTTEDFLRPPGKRFLAFRWSSSNVGT